jgi:hypothetical protein
MTIGRFHFKEGISISLEDGESGEDKIRKVLIKNLDNIQILPEGYRTWQDADHTRYELMVLKNGNGVFRKFAQNNDDAGIARIDLGGAEIRPKIKMGGNIVHLPQDQKWLYIADQDEDKKTTFTVYEVIFHVPGLSHSPKK